MAPRLRTATILHLSTLARTGFVMWSRLFPLVPVIIYSLATAFPTDHTDLRALPLLKSSSGISSSSRSSSSSSSGSEGHDWPPSPYTYSYTSNGPRCQLHIQYQDNPFSARQHSWLTQAIARTWDVWMTHGERSEVESFRGLGVEYTIHNHNHNTQGADWFDDHDVLHAITETIARLLVRSGISYPARMQPRCNNILYQPIDFRRVPRTAMPHSPQHANM